MKQLNQLGIELSDGYQTSTTTTWSRNCDNIDFRWHTVLQLWVETKLPVTQLNLWQHRFSSLAEWLHDNNCQQNPQPIGSISQFLYVNCGCSLSSDVCFVTWRESLFVCVCSMSTWGCTRMRPCLLKAEEFWTHVKFFHVLWGCRPRACSHCVLKAQQGHLSLDSTPIVLSFLPAMFQIEALQRWRGEEREKGGEAGREGQGRDDKHLFIPYFHTASRYNSEPMHPADRRVLM